MRRDSLPVVDNSEVLSEILRVLLSIDRKTLAPESDLLLAVLSFVGSLYTFSAAELLDTADDALRLALGERNAFGLGHELAALENSVGVRPPSGQKGPRRRWQCLVFRAVTRRCPRSSWGRPCPESGTAAPW